MNYFILALVSFIIGFLCAFVPIVIITIKKSKDTAKYSMSGIDNSRDSHYNVEYEEIPTVDGSKAANDFSVQK